MSESTYFEAMDAVLIALVISAPIIAIATAVYLWARRHSTPERTRYRILQAALGLVTAATILFFVLVFRSDADGEARRAQIAKASTPLTLIFVYLVSEMCRCRPGKKP